MAIRFTSEFRSDTGIDYKIEIDDSVFVGSPTTFVVGSEGFTLEYAGETDDIVSPIMSSNVSIPFMVQNALQQTFFEQLVAVQESRFRIKISRWVSGAYKTYWVGYVMQDIAQIEDAPFPYIYELRAVDGLGRLANIDYTFANDVFQNSLALTRVNKMLFNCLSSVGTTDLFASTDTFFETCVNWWENNMVYSSTKDAANEIAVDRRIFSTIDDDGNETYSKVIEVLRQLCVSFGARVYQSNGRFVFEQYSERAAASRIVSTYDRAGAYIATASKSDDVVIDQTVGEARLAGNQFDFLPAIKRCEIEFEQKFVGSRVAQLLFTFTRTTAQPIGFISEDSSAVLEIVCPMMHFNINRTPNTIVAVPSYAIAPIFAMTIKIEDVNNPGTFYYFQRTFNGFSATSPYSTPQWTTTASDYQFDIGNFKFSPYGTAGLSSPVTIQTDQLPVSGELTFQLKQPTLRRVSNGAIYAQPPLYVGLIAGSSIKYDFLANINYISNGQLSPESIVYKASNNATGIDSNLVLELGKTSIADGPLQTGNLAVWNGSIWGGSDLWRKGNSGTYKKLLQLLVTEALALHAKPIRRYNGSFYSSHDISRRYTFDTFDWLFIGGSLNANNENVDGEFFAIARDVTNIVDVNSGLFVGELSPMSVNKVSGPNSFGGVFNDGSIAGMLVDSDTFSVGPFSQPSAGTARITGTTTVDGDTFFTQDVDVTGDLVVDGTIVIDGLGDVATESWVIAQGYLTAESDTLDSVTDRGNVTTNTINVGGVTSDYVLFDTTATPTPSLGMAYWNTDEGTVSLQVNGVSYELGQKEAWIVKNQTGATITKGTVIMAVGALGASARILAGKMVANGSVSPRFILGVAAETIANGADGRVIHRGKLRQFNTSAFAVGDTLFCDPATPGGFTNVEPQAPNLKLPIAFVLSSGTNGSIAIRINTGNRLSEDHDVQLSTLSTGQLLRYNSNRWENWTPNFLTPSNVSGTTNYVSKFTGTNTVGNSQIFDNGTNVGIGTATPNGKLQVEGDFYVNGLDRKIMNYNGAVDYGTLTNNSVRFNQNGVERARISTTGNVGIGTTSPSSILEIAGASPVLTINRTSGTSSTINFNSSGSNFASIISNPSNGENRFSIGPAAAWGGFHTFYTDTSERMRITAAGNVGIGTTSPNEKLTVIGKVYARPYFPVVLSGNGSPEYGTNITMASDTGATQGAVRIWSKYDGSGNAAMTFERATTTQVYNADPQLLTYSESMRISGNGNVGIGTTGPAEKLHVVGNIVVPNNNSLFLRDTANSNGFQIRNTSANVALIFQANNNALRYRAGFSSNAANAHIFAVGADTEIVRFTNDGNVGIGTTSPTSKLYIEGGSANWNETTPGLSVGTIHLDPGTDTNDFGNAITFGASDAGGGTNAQAGIYLRSDGNYGTKMYFATTDSYAAGSKTRMFIGHDGNVGIGTTAPSHKLYVNGDTFVNGVARISSTNPLFFQDYGGGWFMQDTSYVRTYNQKSIWTGAGFFGSEGGLSVGYGGATPPYQGAIINANVGIGTSSPATKLHVSGGFIRVEGSSVDQYFLEGVRTGVSTTLRIYDNSSVPFYDSFNSMYFRANQNGGSGGIIGLLGGNVGINTTSPGGKLEVNHTGAQGATALILRTSDFSTANGTIRWQNNVGTNQAGIGSNYTTGDAGALEFLNGNTCNLIIRSSGNVGVGTTSPAYKLDVTGVGNFSNGFGAPSLETAYRLKFYDNGGTHNDVGIGLDGTAGGGEIMWFNALGGFYFGLGTNGTKVTISNTGNVGIGTTAPSGKLDVSSSAGTYIFNLTNADEGAFKLRSYNGGSASFSVPVFTYGLYYNTQENTAIKFYRGGSTVGGFMTFTAQDGAERMRITAAGDVGIGTTSPSAKLHVIGNATVSATLSTANAKISGTLADSFNQVGTAGQVLSSTGTGIEWITGGGGGGGSTIAVKDEGVSIGSSFSTLDFQGNNIQATASGSTAIITAFNNAGTGSRFGNATSTNYVPGATFGDVEIDSGIVFAVSPDAATGSSKLIATITFGVQNVSFYSDFNDFEFQLYDVSQSIVVPNTTHTWSGYMNKNEGATRTVFTFHIPLDTDVAPGDEIRVQAKQSVSYTPEIYFCAITLLEGTT